MSQECGFFNSQLVGDGEYDRVYLAEQFAAYFASFIGNGVYGKSMQKLEIICKEIPDMTVQVLTGEAWINGWWYRNTDTYTLNLQIADGVLSRIDAIVLRWGNVERDIWLDVVTGEPSLNPQVPALRRDADYYDLRLGYVNVTAGSIKITQAQITDTRLDNSVCGLVTGVVDQIDTTDLYNQFTAYFNEFKQIKEADYNQWTAEKMVQWTEWFEQFKEFIESLENGELLLHVEAMINDIISGLATNDDIDSIINGTFVEEGSDSDKLSGIISMNGLNRFWQEGIKPIEESVNQLKDEKLDVLDTKEEIEANTEAGKAAGARAVKEMFNEMPQFIYDDEGKITGYKTLGGADTVFPFKQGGKITYHYYGIFDINNVTFLSQQGMYVTYRINNTWPNLSGMYLIIACITTSGKSNQSPGIIYNGIYNGQPFNVVVYDGQQAGYPSRVTIGSYTIE